MKTKICLFTLMVVLTGLCGCVFFNRKVEYNFLHDQSEISRIEIIELGEFDKQTGVHEQTVLYVTEDVESFLDAFNQLNCYAHIGDPRGVESTEIAVKIIYDNSEYELINAGGQAHYTIKKGYVNYDGLRYFDYKEFDNFIANYID